MPRTIVIPPGTIADSNAIYGPLGYGDLEQVFGSVFDTSLDGSFAEQDVETGGSANLTTINVGTQVVFVGGSATNTTIQNNGGQDVSGTVTFTTINGTASFQGGLQTIEAGGKADQTTINGGTQEVFPGGSVTCTWARTGKQKPRGGPLKPRGFPDGKPARGPVQNGSPSTMLTNNAAGLSWVPLALVSSSGSLAMLAAIRRASSRV
jgi:autotransporter passenger strand-loop-strand repeat protein